MNWKPKKGKCRICGKEIMIMSAPQKYCTDCAEIAQRLSDERAIAIERAKRIAIRRGTDPEKHRGLENECKHKKSCVYGGQKFCEYMAIEGHSRLLAGYPIRGGKCGAYKRGRKKAQARVQLPAETAWSMTDLRET